MGSLTGKMYPPTLILFLLFNVASSVEIPEANLKRYPGPRIVVLGAAGVGKSVFANALFNRPSDYKPPDEKKCFEGGLAKVDPDTGKSGGLTQNACIESGYFLGEAKNGEITVVDTPGLGMNSVEEQESTESIVQKLKEVEYVHTFAMLYKESDTRATRERLAVFSHYSRIFGKKFLKNVIIVATHWGYEEKAEKNRAKYLEGHGSWLEYQKKTNRLNELEYGNELKAIYFEPWDLIFDESLRYKSYENLNQLYNWSLANDPFHCKDIEVVLDDYALAQQEIANLTQQLAVESECKICQREKAELETKVEEYSETKDVQVGKSKTKMAGIGIGCTVLGIIIGFIAFRYYKMNTNNAEDNDEDDEDLEKLGGNTETTVLENNQTEEIKTEQKINSTESENLTVQ